MSTLKEKVSTFTDLFIAIVKGDDAEALSIKTKARATKALEAAIHSAEDLSNLEDKIEEAENYYNKALVNHGVLITPDNKESYVKGVVRASKSIRDAKEELEAQKELIADLKAALERAKK